MQLHIEPADNGNYKATATVVYEGLKFYGSSTDARPTAASRQAVHLACQSMGEHFKSKVKLEVQVNLA